MNGGGGGDGVRHLTGGGADLILEMEVMSILSY